MEILSYEEIKEQVGDEPPDIFDETTYSIVDEYGRTRSFNNIENANIIKERTGNPVETHSYSKEELDKSKKELQEYYSKVNQIWFDQLCDIYEEINPETLMLLYNKLLEFSIDDQGYFDPDEILERIDGLLPMFSSYFDYVLSMVGDQRKAFYFKDSKNKIIKL